jgi:hypothetical protein
MNIIFVFTEVKVMLLKLVSRLMGRFHPDPDG